MPTLPDLPEDRPELAADTLRRAAAKMRETAQAATPGEWVSAISTVTVPFPQTIGGIQHLAQCLYVPDARHMAAWHPAVALAVADWLECVAGWLVEGMGSIPGDVDWTNYADAWSENADAALRLARTFLGEQVSDR